jgi:hypothetical protein
MSLLASATVQNCGSQCVHQFGISFQWRGFHQFAAGLYQYQHNPLGCFTPNDVVPLFTASLNIQLEKAFIRADNRYTFIISCCWERLHILYLF